LETLFLARHALSGSNRAGTASSSAPGEGLTSEGVEQARMLAKALENEAIALGVATELRRTQETLEIALSGRNVPRIVVPELDEIDFGDFNGRSLDSYRSWASSAGPEEPAPGEGESRTAVAVRYARGLRRLLERPEPTVLMIGHALQIRYTLDGAQGLPPAPRMAPVQHAELHRLSACDVQTAARLLDEWSRAPRFR
jgi:broad specificity phosphatase PhoE